MEHFADYHYLNLWCTYTLVTAFVWHVPEVNIQTSLVSFLKKCFPDHALQKIATSCTLLKSDFLGFCFPNLFS